MNEQPLNSWRETRLLAAQFGTPRLAAFGVIALGLASAVAETLSFTKAAERLGLAQPTVSHHLKVLVDAGLLTRERRGQWAWFTLVPERLALVRRALEV